MFTLYIVYTLNEMSNYELYSLLQNFGETVNSFETLAESKKIGVSTVINSATMAFLKNGKTNFVIVLSVECNTFWASSSVWEGSKQMLICYTPITLYLWLESLDAQVIVPNLLCFFKVL